MKNYLSIATVFAFFALSLPFGCVFAKTHTLKKGETLASVARKYYGEPVFGAKGTLKKLYKLNPWAEKNPNSVEPGKEIVIDGEPKEEKIVLAPPVSAPAPTVPVPPAMTTATTPPAPPAPSGPVVDANAIAAEEKKAWDQKKIEDANAAAAKAQEKQAEPVQCPPVAPVEATSQMKNETADKLTFAQANKFFVTPFYSSSSVSSKNPTSDVSYDLKSSGSYGARLGWDHRFNKSFSMIVEASTQIWDSGAANTTTAGKVADKINLYKAEVALLNNIGDHSRFGIGFQYGTHMFIENYDATPANETAVTFTGLDPVVMAEFALYDSSSWEIPLEIKWSPLGAKIGKGVAGGINPGNEFLGRLSLVQKNMNSSIIYGLSYMTNDQSEKDRSQKRSDLNVELGMVF